MYSCSFIRSPLPKGSPGGTGAVCARHALALHAALANTRISPLTVLMDLLVLSKSLVHLARVPELPLRSHRCSHSVRHLHESSTPLTFALSGLHGPDPRESLALCLPTLLLTICTQGGVIAVRSLDCTKSALH